MYIYRLVFLLVLAIYIFSPNILDWWTSPCNAWYSPYAICSWIIIIGFYLEWRRDLIEFYRNYSLACQHAVSCSAVWDCLDYRAGRSAPQLGATPPDLHPQPWCLC